MEVVRANVEVRRRVDAARRSGRRIGLVPTMGYLHEGHARLVESARAECDAVGVSIFVNPTQFGPQEDLARYPRDEARDLALCERLGVDWVYMPAVEELYPHGQPGTLVVPPGNLTDTLCGAFRPGHFAGVATVVAKLFALFQPDRAYFGLKDFQQTAVIRRLVDDLCFGVELVLVPTVRETDGLAMSSRNVYLSDDERRAALTLSRALQTGWEQARLPGARPSTVLEAAARVLSSAPSVQVQYLSVVDRDSLDAATRLDHPAVLAVAAYVGRTRLIDNVALDGPPPLGEAVLAKEGAV